MLKNLVGKGKSWEDLKPQGFVADTGICPWPTHFPRWQRRRAGALCRRERALSRRQNGSRINWGGIFWVEEFCAGSRRCKRRIWGHVKGGWWMVGIEGKLPLTELPVWLQAKIF